MSEQQQTINRRIDKALHLLWVMPACRIIEGNYIICLYSNNEFVMEITQQEFLEMKGMGYISKGVVHSTIQTYNSGWYEGWVLTTAKEKEFEQAIKNPAEINQHGVKNLRSSFTTKIVKKMIPAIKWLANIFGAIAVSLLFMILVVFVCMGIVGLMWVVADIAKQIFK